MLVGCTTSKAGLLLKAKKYNIVSFNLGGIMPLQLTDKISKVGWNRQSLSENITS